MDQRTPGTSGPRAAKSIGDRAQLELLELLRSRDPRLAQTYEGVLNAFSNEQNPDHLSQAAHSARELFDALPSVVGVERKKTADLGDKVTLIAAAWKKAIGRTMTVKEGWAGEIDGPLKKVLQALAEFFRWFEEEHPQHSVERDMALDRFDPGRGQLPEALRKERRQTLNELAKYMNAVAHHNITSSRREFADKLARAESFLRTLMKPTPIADQKTMDEILKGGTS